MCVRIPKIHKHSTKTSTVYPILKGNATSFGIVAHPSNRLLNIKTPQARPRTRSRTADSLGDLNTGGRATV